MAKKILRQIFRFHGFWRSLLVAFRGFVYLFLYHRNMRLIFMIGLLAILLGFNFKLSGVELVALSVTATLVFMAEIFNTAIELLMNVLTTRYRIRIKLVKDISAAVVVLTCINSLAVGYILFIRKLFK